VLILSGSQQGIDLVARLFIDPGTTVAVESPTYLAALQVFRFFGARFVPYKAEALDVQALRLEKPAFAYAIPTFQNPSGRFLMPPSAPHLLLRYRRASLVRGRPIPRPGV
jgi:2-aminoadipate transaminase